MRLYQNLTIVPFAELLASTRGGNDHRGGPVFEVWDDERESRHCRRGGSERLCIEPDRPATAEHEDSEVAYLGPLCHHFGHQVADFSMRILPTIRQFDGPLVFAAPAGMREDPPRWFWGILDWFGVAHDRVRILREPTTFSKVWIAPQTETIFGPPPADALLDDLDENYRRRKAERPVSGLPKEGAYYLSRAKLNRGVIAGERAIEAFLRRNGVHVLYPEDHDVTPLLLSYAEAPVIIMSEGSAAHTMQFLGRQLGRVIMINRDDTSKFGDNFLPKRCKEFHRLNAVIDGISPNAGRYRENGLSIADTPALVASLSKLAGLDPSRWSDAEYAEEANNSFRRWRTEHLPTRRDMTPDAARLIEEKADRHNLAA